MADYREIHCPYGDDFEGGDECDRCEQYELCMETPVADVIERAEYIKSQNEVLRLGDLFYKANQDAMIYEGMYRELRSKIDKANMNGTEEKETIKGKCPDCNRWCTDKAIDGACYCSSFHTYTGYEFYCADFEHR